MTPDRLLAANSGEAYKGSVHMALFALSSVCLAYNIGALLSRPSRNLAVNALVYGGMVALEARQVHCHWTNPALHVTNER